MRRPYTLLASTLACAMLLSILGCKPDAAVKRGEVVGRGSNPAQAPPPPPASDVNGQPTDTSTTVDPATFGSIHGAIALNGKAPKSTRLDMSMDPACALASKSAGASFSEDYVVKDGKLANVYLYIKDGPPAAMAVDTTTPPAILDQKGCHFIPHVLAVPAGGWVEIRNSDNTVHNIHTTPIVEGNTSFDISQGPKGAPQRMQFNRAEQMVPVRCNNHRWMTAFINVASTPYAVSEADGHFEIKNLPPGHYTLAAVHEKLGEQTMTVVVNPHTSSEANLTFNIK